MIEKVMFENWINVFIKKINKLHKTGLKHDNYILDENDIPTSIMSIVYLNMKHKHRNKNFIETLWKRVHALIIKNHLEDDTILFFWLSYYMTWDIIQKHPEFHWNTSNVSANSSITWDIVLQNPSYDWNFKYMSTNENITVDIVKQYPEPYKILTTTPENAKQQTKYNWCMSSMTYHTPLETILENMFYNWDFMWLGERVPFEVILKYPEIDWGNYEISTNPNIKIEDVISHPELKWDMDCLAYNPSITIEDLKKHPEININKKYFSYNTNITEKTMEENPNFPWSYDCLSENPNIPLSYILNHPEKNWDYSKITYTNLDMTYDILEKWLKEKKVKLTYLTSNTFINPKCVIREKEEYLDAYKKHYSILQQVHEEMIDVLYNYDNSWYFENLKV